MGRLYTAQFNAQAATAVAADLFELTSPSNRSVLIHAVILGQYSDFGDAQDELLSVIMRRGTSGTTSGSTPASTPTPVPLETNSSAAGSTVECYNTTAMSGGTITVLYSDAFNVRGGYQMIFTPEMRPMVSQSERFTVSILAPADTLTMNGTLVFEEIG